LGLPHLEWSTLWNIQDSSKLSSAVYSEVRHAQVALPVRWVDLFVKLLILFFSDVFWISGPDGRFSIYALHCLLLDFLLFRFLFVLLLLIVFDFTFFFRFVAFLLLLFLLFNFFLNYLGESDRITDEH
jgi:hypothetical protein